MGPLNLTWVAIGGGFDGPNPYNMMNFISRVPDGACLTLETLMRSVLPVNTMATAMGLHTRVGNEDTIWSKPGQKITAIVNPLRDGRPGGMLYRLTLADGTMRGNGTAPPPDVVTR